MKINLASSKQKKKMSNMELQEKKKKQIENMFSTSDDEEAFDLENKQNKKIEEKERRRFEEELKHFIEEHEQVPEKKSPCQKENEKHKEKESHIKKNIVYLGYKGKELTKLKGDITEHEHISDRVNFNKQLKNSSDSSGSTSDTNSSRSRSRSNRSIHCNKSNSGTRKSSETSKKWIKVSELKTSEPSERKTIISIKQKAEENNQEKYRKRKEHQNEDIATEVFVNHQKKEINVKEIFEKENENKKKEGYKENEKAKPKYMEALINSAKRRKIEKEILIQKKLKVDSEKKEKVFITSAYRKVMMDRELIKQEILKEEEEKEKEKLGVQRSFNLSTFYKNINAPSNYDRMNRRSHTIHQSDSSDN